MSYAVAIIVALTATCGTAELTAADLDAGVVADSGVRDFLIQDVCLDLAGKVIPGRSPIDDPGGCRRRRDLLPGERLPYHKHDHPSPDQRLAAPTGYQRHDSFPVETAGLGVVAEQSFDFGAGDGRRFGVFDDGADGGDVIVIGPDAIAIAATEDSGGFGLWVGECRGEIDAAALAQSWLVAQFDPQRPASLEGQIVARLNGVPGLQPASCPARFNAAFTAWRIASFAYRAGPGQGRPVTLSTLISDHYGGSDPATADHVERFYFTRELGGTRWERWQNVNGNASLDAADIAQTAAAFAASGRCSASEMPPGGAAFAMIDCREWTGVVPPADPAGDLPGFFIAAIRARPGTPAFFAAPQK